MKKIVSLILSLAICFSLMPTAFAADAASKFTDVPADAWYRDELNYALEHGYISGTSETTFSPDLTVTRGQFVTILGRMEKVPFETCESQFTDVGAGLYYTVYVEWAAYKGYVKGVGDNKFAPESPITKEQLGQLLYNYTTKCGKEIGYHEESMLMYSDMEDISEWAYEAMSFAMRANLLPMDAEQRVRPKDGVTRAECVVALVRLAKLYDNASSSATVSAQSVKYDEAALRHTYGNEAYEEAVKIRNELVSAGKITSSSNQRQIAGAYYHWLDMNVRYDDDYRHQSGYAYGALVNRRAVCDGFTRAYQLLLALDGIESYRMIGVAGDNHAWNKVILEGRTLYIDVTQEKGCFAESGMMSDTHGWQYDDAEYMMAELERCEAWLGWKF